MTDNHHEGLYQEQLFENLIKAFPVTEERLKFYDEFFEIVSNFKWGSLNNPKDFDAYDAAESEVQISLTLLFAWLSNDSRSPVFKTTLARQLTKRLRESEIVTNDKLTPQQILHGVISSLSSSLADIRKNKSLLGSEFRDEKIIGKTGRSRLQGRNVFFKSLATILERHGMVIKTTPNSEFGQILTYAWAYASGEKLDPSVIKGIAQRLKEQRSIE